MLKNLEKNTSLLINLYIYIYKVTNKEMVMRDETKLTSVKILKNLYEQFKFKTVNFRYNY